MFVSSYNSVIVWDLLISVVFVLVLSFGLAFVRRHSHLMVHIPQSSEDILFVKKCPK